MISASGTIVLTDHVASLDSATYAVLLFISGRPSVVGSSSRDIVSLRMSFGRHPSFSRNGRCRVSTRIVRPTSAGSVSNL